MSALEIAGLQAQLARTQRAMDRFQAEREADRARELRATVAKELGKHGVGKAAQQAAGHLIDVAKQVRHVDGRAVFVDAFGVETDLAAGLKSWAASEEGGIYRDTAEPAATTTAPMPWTSVNRPASTDAKDQPLFVEMLAAQLGRTFTPDDLAAVRRR